MLNLVTEIGEDPFFGWATIEPIRLRVFWPIRLQFFRLGLCPSFSRSRWAVSVVSPIEFAESTPSRRQLSSSLLSMTDLNLIRSSALAAYSNIVPSSSSISRTYVKLVNFYGLSSDQTLQVHPDCTSTWTLSIILEPLIWSSYLILFIRLQPASVIVRELGQLFEYPSIDHPIRSSGS